MSLELHLPDLPEVPLSLGQPRALAPRAPWHLRLRETLSSFLPLLLMLLLALASWWLVKNSPPARSPAEAVAQRVEPDYTMSDFSVERFDAQGRLKLSLAGSQMRHYPDTDRIEIDGAMIRSYAPDGRMTVAQAQRALAAGDGSELQLLGSAEIVSEDAQGSKLVMRGEFLHAFLLTERIRTNRPVSVQHGATEVFAAGLDYNHATQRLELAGPTRMTLAPPARAGR